MWKWMQMQRVRPRALLIGFHLIGLLVASALADDVVKTFQMRYVIENADPLDCKHPTIRFEEPCTCYKLRQSQQVILNCDHVAFRFFPPLPLSLPLFLASFRDTGYQSLPTELFAQRHNGLQALDLSNNRLSLITTTAFRGLEDSLLFLNLSGNSLGSSFQPALDIPELRVLKNLQVVDLSGNSIKILSTNFFHGLNRLRTVFLRENDLLDLSAFSSHDFPSLSELDLGGNRIFRLESNSLGNLRNLTVLSLRDNFIGQMGKNAFTGTNLKLLDLSWNRIAFVEGDTLGGIERNLEVLDLSGNALRSLPSFSLLANLITLNLSANQLEDLETAKTNLPLSLQILDVSGNFLTKQIISDISPFSALSALYLSRNLINSFCPKPTETIPSLTVLDLKATNLSKLPANLFQTFPNLIDLDIGYNTFPMGIAQQSTRLTRLSLRKCRIRQLDPGFFENLPKLTALDLSGSSLDTLPENIHQTLSTLNVSRNKLSTVPDLRNTSLIVLDISRNNLQNILMENLPVTTLTVLNFSGNQLDRWPTLNPSGTEHRDFLGALRPMGGQDGAATFPLRVLDVSDNSIQSVEQISSGWAELQSLYLAWNRIEGIMSFFLSDLSRLEQVDLAGNVLTTLANRTFLRLSSLQRVDLRQNQIKMFNSFAFDSVPKLNYLDLSENQLQSFHPKHPFQRLTSVRTLILSNNNLKDFSLVDFVANSGISRLFMERCKIAKLPAGTFDNMDNLAEVYLNENAISELQEGLFSTTPQLQIIHLQRNDISSLSENVFRKVRRVKLLNLGYNKLEMLKKDTFAKEKTDRVEELNLEKNKFTEVPLSALSDQEFNLIALNLDSNRIPTIPPGSLISTKDLNLAFNPLKADTIRQLLADPKLTFSLDLSGTGLNDVPAMQLQFLTRLSLSHNRLTSCGEASAWERGGLLQVLDLSFNWITNLKDAQLTVILPRLAFLKVLNLSSNLIRNIRENDFAGLVNLETLDVSNQPRLETFDISNFMQLPRLRNLLVYNYPRLINFPLEDISYQPLFLRSLSVEIKKPVLRDDLDGFLTPGLETLSVYGRSLKEVTSRTFRSLNPSRLRLSFENISIETLPASVFAHFSRNSLLDLRLAGSRMSGTEIAGLLQNTAVEHGDWVFERNQLDCTCNVSLLQPVWKSVKEASEPNIPDVICDGPAAFRGKNALLVQTTEESCMGIAVTGKPVQMKNAPGNSGKTGTDRVHSPLDTSQSRFATSDTEPDIIFEVTSTTAAPDAGYRIEGMIAGVILATLLVTGAVIVGIICWNRKEKRRQARYLHHFQDSSTGLACESQYAVLSNPDIVAHPTWYPPPKPVFVVPLSSPAPVSFDPRHVGFYMAPDTESSAPSVDYTIDIGEPTSESEFTVTGHSVDNEVEMDSRITYSYMDADDTTDEGPYSEDYFPDDESVTQETSYRSRSRRH